MGKLAKQGKHTILFLGIGYGVMFIGGILIARVLGPQDRGALGLVQQTYLYLMAVAMMGLAASNVFLAARRPEERATLRRNSAIHALVVGLLFAAGLMVLGQTFAPTIFAQVPQGLWFPFAFMLPIAMAFNYYLGLERGMGLIEDANKHNLILTVGQMVLALVALQQTRQVVPVAWGLLLGLIVALFVINGNVMPRVGFGYLSRGVYFEQLRFGLPYMLYSLLGSLASRFDLFLVAGMGKLEDAGRYAVALTLAEVLWKFPSALGFAIFPILSANPDEEPARVARLTRIVTTLTLLLSVLWALPAFGVCFFLGDAYAGTFLAFVLLLPGTWAAGVLETLSAARCAKGRPASVLLPHAIFAATMVGLDLYLIPRYGIAGAAVGSSVGALVGAAVMLIGTSRAQGIGAGSFLVASLSEIRAAWDERPAKVTEKAQSSSPRRRR